MIFNLFIVKFGCKYFNVMLFLRFNMIFKVIFKILCSEVEI